MKNELLKPGDIIEIKLEDEKYICIVANIDGAYRLISLNDGYDFMVEEDGHDFKGYTREDLEKYLTNRDWDVINYYRGNNKEVTKMRKTEIREAIERLEELKETIYEVLNEMEEILREVAPDEYPIAKSYWMAHIDEALENRGQWLGGSLVSYIDTIDALEEMMEEEE